MIGTRTSTAVIPGSKTTSRAIHKLVFVKVQCLRNVCKVADFHKTKHSDILTRI